MFARYCCFIQCKKLLPNYFLRHLTTLERGRGMRLPSLSSSSSSMGIKPNLTRLHLTLLDRPSPTDPRLGPAPDPEEDAATLLMATGSGLTGAVTTSSLMSLVDLDKSLEGTLIVNSSEESLRPTRSSLGRRMGLGSSEEEAETTFSLVKLNVGVAPVAVAAASHRSSSFPTLGYLSRSS